MDSAPQFYCETFPGLTPLGGLSKPARTWARGRAWRSGPLAYNRKPAIKVAVTMEQHGVLLGGLKRSVNAWWAMAFAAATYVPLLVIRMKQEEVALAEKFGEPYRQYQREVGALVPKCASCCKHAP